MHSHPEVIVAQETYLHGLVKHVNPYTGLAYKDDPSIVGFEINNEPCHSGTKEEVKVYINRMLKAINKTGNRKPVFDRTGIRTDTAGKFPSLYRPL